MFLCLMPVVKMPNMLGLDGFYQNFKIMLINFGLISNVFGFA
jgi:hypothetical protein